MRYYINGKRVTKEDAERQEALNNKIMEIEDNEEWLKAMRSANFIVKIKEA